MVEDRQRSGDMFDNLFLRKQLDDSGGKKRRRKKIEDGVHDLVEADDDFGLEDLEGVSTSTCGTDV